FVASNPRYARRMGGPPGLLARPRLRLVRNPIPYRAKLLVSVTSTRTGAASDRRRATSTGRMWKRKGGAAARHRAMLSGGWCRTAMAQRSRTRDVAAPRRIAHPRIRTTPEAVARSDAAMAAKPIAEGTFRTLKSSTSAMAPAVSPAADEAVEPARNQ